MKIRLDLSNFNEALSFASTVKPVNQAGDSAYLFTVNDGRCFIHSQGAHDYVRTEVRVLAIDDESKKSPQMFAYPADRVAALKFLDGWIEIATGVDEGRHWLNYLTESGAKSSRSTLDPTSFNTLDRALKEATGEYLFPTILLKEGLSTTSGYALTNPSDQESPNTTVQIFDTSDKDWAKGDGTMYAADGQRACYFYSPEFEGKGLAVHIKHMPHLMSFLGKCQSQVKIKIGTTMTFVVDQVKSPDGTETSDGAVFGWVNRTKTHPKYRYYPAKLDKVRLIVPRDHVLKTLRHLMSEMKDRAKIRVIYDNPNLRFVSAVSKEAVESASVVCDPQSLGEGLNSGEAFDANVDIKAFIGLFDSCRDYNVELRVASAENNGEMKHLFRTIARSLIGDSGKSYVSTEDAKEPCYECLVTHFITSMA